MRWISGCLAIAAVAAISCAGPRKSAGPSMASEAEPPQSEDERLYGHEMARKEEIQDLWMQVRGWRVEGGYQAEPPQHLINRAMRLSVSELRVCEQYPEPKTPTCRDVCSLKEAICDNAESICRIADDLGGDPWADDKCHSAKGSCKEASERCCTCVSEEGLSTSDGDVCGSDADTP